MFQDVSRELLRQGYHIRFRPVGRSMQPTIRDGEAITVAPVSLCEVRRGDILLYSTCAGLKAHRVVKTGISEEAGAYFITRGDSSVETDAPVGAARVLGRVVSVERDGRTISLAGRRAFIRQSVFIRAFRIGRRIAAARVRIYRWRPEF